MLLIFIESVFYDNHVFASAMSDQDRKPKLFGEQNVASNVSMSHLISTLSEYEPVVS